ncbi:MAG TPA: hypothetical protein VF209_03760 [Patescibacteria group bacterium]
MAQAESIAGSSTRISSGLRTLREFVSPPVHHTEKIYPRSVLDAIREAGTLEEEELIDLINNNFPREFLYLGTKALAATPEIQEQFLQEALSVFMDKPADDEVFKAELERLLEHFLKNVSVKAAKLAQLNRYSSAGWLGKFKELILTTLEETPSAVPVLLAHVPLLALPDFVKMYQEAGHQALYVLNPAWVDDSESEYAGYRVELQDIYPQVRLITKDETQELSGKSVVLIDDTIKSGKTMEKVRQFLTSEASVEDSQISEQAVTRVPQNEPQKLIETPMPHSEISIPFRERLRNMFKQ